MPNFEIKKTKALEETFYNSNVIAEEQSLQFITPELLLSVIIRQQPFAMAVINTGIDEIAFLETQNNITSHIYNSEKVPANLKIQPVFSEQFKKLLEISCQKVVMAEKECADVPHIVCAMLELEDSWAAYFLKNLIGDKVGLFISNLVSFYETRANIDNTKNEDGIFEDDDDEDWMNESEFGPLQDTSWKTLVTCLNDTAEEHTPLIGRKEELERTIQILCRKDKNNPIHIGEPGVGKTAIVYGLAQLIIHDKVPSRLKGARIYSMNMGSMIAGTQYRGDFEKRMKLVMEGAKEEGNVIIYIDEIHNLIGAGKGSEGSLDASNMLKPYLESGDIRFIGSTTYDEYNRYMSTNKGIIRRFQQIDIQEPSVEESIQILKGLQKHYEKFHNVIYRQDAIDYAVKASAKYINDRFLPDKAIDIIDEAGSYLELHPNSRQKQYVTRGLIQKILEKICKVDAIAMKEENNDNLRQLYPAISNQIFGQDKAVREVVEAVEMAKAGLTDEDKPLASLLFVGPTGVGKTEVARVLAKQLGIQLVRFDMSEYTEKQTVAKLIGSPAGYVGYEDGGLLTAAIRKSPNCVLLMDEIEKAHSDIYNILLQVMDYARLTDNKGQKADFRNVILIMTSNAGAQYASQANIGFQGNISRGEAMIKSVKKTFKPEFLNRLSATVIFHDMDEEMAKKILTKKISVLSNKLKNKKITLTLTKDAELHLLSRSFTREYGAREMDRVINHEIKNVLIHEILYGKLRNGGDITLGVKNGQIVIQ